MSASQLHEFSHRGFESDQETFIGKLQKVSRDNFILTTSDGYVYSEESHYGFNPKLSEQKSKVNGILYVTNDETLETYTIYILADTSHVRLEKLGSLKVGFNNENLLLTMISCESEENEMDLKMDKLRNVIEKTKNQISEISKHVTSKNIKELETARTLLEKQELETKKNMTFNVATTSWEFTISPNSECYIEAHRFVYMPDSKPKQAPKRRLNQETETRKYPDYKMPRV